MAHMEERKGAYIIWVGNVKKTDRFEGRGVDRRIILKSILKKVGLDVVGGLILLSPGQIAGFVERDNELNGFHKTRDVS